MRARSHKRVHVAFSGAQAAWRAMEGLVSEGLVRSLGIQDASVEALTEVLGYAAIPPAVHSLEVHPGNRNDALLAFCRSQVSQTLPVHEVCLTRFLPPLRHCAMDLVMRHALFFVVYHC